jgi:hypothetical protein
VTWVQKAPLQLRNPSFLKISAGFDSIENSQSNNRIKRNRKMNLTEEFPRGPRERMNDLVHIPRMIDKARAARQNTLGEYIYPCPMDKMMLEFLKVEPDAFQEKACNDTEESLSNWITLQCQNRPPEDLDVINNKILKARPDNAEKQEYFDEVLKKIDPSRTDITTWVELIDLEEGRL